MKQLYFKTSDDWRDWLKENYNKSDGIWLVYYKKKTGIPTMDYEASVEEALCYGWIDGLIKKIDNEKYSRKFTPRKDKSYWSSLNKKRAEKMIAEKKMRKPGLDKIKATKKSGKWNEDPKPDIDLELHPLFKSELRKNPVANKFFRSLPPSHKEQYLLWINSAKRAETIQKRVEKSIKMLNNNERLGMV